MKLHARMKRLMLENKNEQIVETKLCVYLEFYIKLFFSYNHSKFLVLFLIDKYYKSKIYQR